MSSSEPTKSKPTPQQPRRPAVLFESLPGIKIITPPKGQFSPKVDERCFTYCAQSVGGRIHRTEPWCRTVCIRNVFMHEVRNVLTFRSHRKVDSEGNAKYVLPSEGQEKTVIPNDGDETPKMPETKHWESGTYIWYSKDVISTIDHIGSMMSLEDQRRLAEVRAKKREVWKDYQDFLRTRSNVASRSGTQHRATPPLTPNPPSYNPLPESTESTATSLNSPTPPSTPSTLPARFLHPPPNPMPDRSHRAVLVRPTSPIPELRKKIEKLLAPTHTLLGIFHESIVSGNQLKFWIRVWDKAWTKEPFVLASRTVQWSYDKWKDGPPEESDSKP